MNLVSHLLQKITFLSLPNNAIRKGRIAKEKQLITTKNVTWIQHPTHDIVQFQTDLNSIVFIYLTALYPFHLPYLKFEISDQYYVTRNLESLMPYDHYFANPWTPKITLQEIILNASTFLKLTLQIRTPYQMDIYAELIFKIRSQASKTTALLSLFLIALLLRIFIGLGSYSGYNHPPRFGDYEAQRHWMELAINSPPIEWYQETTLNDLNWWRLDYPPLSGHFAWLTGIFSFLYDPQSVEPYNSRGYETLGHKNFMRWTVIISDFFFLIPAIVLIMRLKFRKLNFDLQNGALLYVVTCPLLLLIDHGHFQYNCIMLGLTAYAAYFLALKQIIIASILFTMAINFKIMGLYYALGFFAFIVGQLAIKSRLRSPLQPFKLNIRRIPHFILNVALVGIAVILTTVIIWYPWLWNLKDLSQVISAIFPFHRGLYQLQVGTFWCASNIVIKWQTLFSRDTIVLLSTFLTLLSSLPSVVCLYITPQFKTLTIGLFTISQAFFLFGFHVHEKTILLPLIWLLLDMRRYGSLVNDYVLMAIITHHAVMRENGLWIQYFALLLVYMVLSQEYFRKNQEILKIKSEPAIIKIMLRIHRVFLRNGLLAIYFICVVLELMIEPPARYPFLFPLIYAMIGFYIYTFSFVYVNLLLIQLTRHSLRKRKTE